jgi:hypothetical protein
LRENDSDFGFSLTILGCGVNLSVNLISRVWHYQALAPRGQLAQVWRLQQELHE